MLAPLHFRLELRQSHEQKVLGNVAGLVVNGRWQMVIHKHWDCFLDKRRQPKHVHVGLCITP